MGLNHPDFLAAGLIDEITITTIPILIGGGKPLFGALLTDIRLELMDSKSYPFGFVQSRYRRLI
jgi:dihydrofolate reductase